MKRKRLALIVTALCLSAAAARADDFDEELAATLKLVVMIHAQLGAAPVFGSGIVFGREKDRLYILTANHVVRRGKAEAAGIRVNLRSLPAKALPARLLPQSDANLDIAVLAVDNLASQGVDVCALELDQLGNPAALKRGSDVYPVGNPNGSAWGMPVKPDQVSTVTADEIAFQSPFLAVGMSGGALLNEDADLVAMVRKDEPPFGLALSLDKALSTVARWGYPEQLWQDQADGSTPLHRAAAGADAARLKVLLAEACVNVNPVDKSRRTPLHYAAPAENPVAVQLLLQAGAKVDAKTDYQLTPLHEAAAKGRVGAATLLLAAGADVNARESFGETALFEAVKAGSLGVAKLLLAHGASVNNAEPDSTASPLGAAVSRGTAEMVRLLTAGGTDVNGSAAAKDLHAAPMLYIAAERGDPEILQQLIAAGANVNARSRDRGPALEIAVKEKRLEAVRVLLAAGADPHAALYLAAEKAWARGMNLLLAAGAPVDEYARGVFLGGTPLHFAVIAESPEAVNVLLAAGASQLVKSRESNLYSGRTPLCLAHEWLWRNRAKGSEIFKTLIAHAGSDIDAMAGKEGCGLFDEAATKGDVVTVSALLKAGAASHGKGSEPLITAAVHGQVEIVKLMLDAKVDLNSADARGYTALHSAFVTGNGTPPQENWAQIARLLLGAGANVKTVIANGNTPLHDAVRRQWPVEIVKLLLAAGADPNLRNQENPSHTPLSLAIWLEGLHHDDREVDTAKALLAGGANPNGDEENPPLLDAAGDGEAEIVKALVDAKADLNITYRMSGYTPLAHALSRDPNPRLVETVRVLLAAGAKVNTFEDSTGTPLHAAVRHRWPVEIIKLLLAAGADPNAKNHNDATPISIATEMNQTEILSVLRRQQ
jgi:ankyrin repeat protein